MILTQESKKNLLECMRNHVANILKESTQLTAKAAKEKTEFLKESATYEQLLNITLNPNRETNYLPDYILEGAFAVVREACLTGRKNIGINAITEGAIKLQKKTGAVITESMLDAALNAVTKSSILQIVKEHVLAEAVDLTLSYAYKGSDHYKNYMDALKAYNTANAAGAPADTLRSLEAAKNAAWREAQIYRNTLQTLPKEQLNDLARPFKRKLLDDRKAELNRLRNTKVQDLTPRQLEDLRKGDAKLAAKGYSAQGGQKLSSATRGIEKFNNTPASDGKPWLKYGLMGAAGLGAGLYAWKKWKDNKRRKDVSDAYGES